MIIKERIKKIKEFEDNLEAKKTHATRKMAGKIEETKKDKNPFKFMFQNFGYKVIRLKYNGNIFLLRLK